MYQEIKSRHMELIESEMQRKKRLTTAWDDLCMGSESSSEFGAAFEEAVMELELVGLKKGQQELLSDYLRKVGLLRAAAIQRDVWPWTDPGG